MIKRPQLRERDLYWATLGALLVLVMLADALLIARHHHALRESQREQAVAEIDFLSGLVRESLANEQFHLVEMLVGEWGRHNTLTTYLAVETPEGFVLARYALDTPARDAYLLKRPIDYRQQRSVLVKLETDLGMAVELTREYAVQVVFGSIVLLALFAQMLMLLDRSRRQRVLEVWAHQDGLTGLANRRRFERTLDMEWRRARRQRSSLALIMADVDAFKAYNDRLGHPAGDDCLRKVATALSECVSRPADLVARYGGEEFAVILPDTELVSARQLAEAMRTKVEGLQITHPSTSHAPVVTLSFGVAAMVPVSDHTPAELIARADRALYNAKAAGGNRATTGPAAVTVQSLSHQSF